MSDREVEEIEFSGAMLNGEVYLRALDVVASLRATAAFCGRMVDEADEEDLDREDYAEVVAFEALRVMFEQEADSIDVVCMHFINDED